MASQCKSTSQSSSRVIDPSDLQLGAGEQGLVFALFPLILKSLFKCCTRLNIDLRVGIGVTAGCSGGDDGRLLYKSKGIGFGLYILEKFLLRFPLVNCND